MPADPVLGFVRWRDAKADPPESDDGLYFTDGDPFLLGWCNNEEYVGWVFRDVDRLEVRARRRPSVWCDPRQPVESEHGPLRVDDLKDAYACLAWMVAQEEPDIVGLDGSSADRLRHAIEQQEVDRG